MHLFASSKGLTSAKILASLIQSVCVGCRFGGFCQDVDNFDAELFRFAPAEAAATDPAQRVLMQQTLLALSDAAAVMGSEVSAFTGMPQQPPFFFSLRK